MQHRLTLFALAFSVLALPPAHAAPIQLRDDFQHSAQDSDGSPNGITTDAGFGMGASTPLIDRYGQLISANYPGKIAADSDLDPEAKKEYARLSKLGAPAGFDAFGGRTDLGWTSQASGYFRVEKHMGTWWFITPAGHPCFYTSVSAAPSPDWPGTPVTGREGLYSGLPDRTGRFADAWKTDMWGENQGTSYFSFRAANLIRRFSGDWRAKEAALTVGRLRTLGFCGVAKWGGVDGLPKVPVLHIDAPRLLRHPDIFDPSVDQKVTESLTSQITPHLRDPEVVGWSIGNQYDEIVTTDEITDILGRDADTAAKKALVDDALSSIYGGDPAKLASSWQITADTAEEIYASRYPQPPASDLEAMRRFFADKYYAFLYNAVKAIDPNHLYIGFWISSGPWLDDSDWALIAAHVDVIGYDRYADQFADDAFAKLLASTDKPAYCGEFSYPPDFDGARGFGRYGTFVHSEEEAGIAYDRWIHDAARNPYVVGGGWFEYFDEPLTGRGPGQGPEQVYGENYAFGLYTEQDQPRWAMLDLMRSANLAAARIRNGVRAGN